MSERKFATKAALQERRGKRRTKEWQWHGFGAVILQSALAKEFIKIDTARQRARLAALRGDERELERATQDLLLGVCFGLVLDGDRQPFFTPDDKDLILELDASITDPLLAEALEFCSDSSETLEDVKKN